ncbi:uncharacterized membrane protein YjfL (UPF0719 family) [Lipingzhangella halophila]|uniref:Uncharacterized membrane protein YjfL (UPF0719 family) n=1 Tax=Lipingzhangella halophila TaxID=1783352 RepID=A0A7W7RDC3_9ACTN|nr:DUF350 domain-containing protein [Lipingzhangella halophila]MBB4929543.1 uncharacterized membrane protein YjfL (UPF0719 family) [Lipingzhangella halophila]
MDILLNSGAALAYGIAGMLVMVLGYLLVDLITPGRLHRLIWEEQNRNASLIVSANTLGVAIVVVTAIFASEEGLAMGLVTTVAYGVVGVLMMTASFLLIDLLTPAKLGIVLSGTQLHPAAWVNASAHIAVALVIAAAIS